MIGKLGVLDASVHARVRYHPISGIDIMTSIVHRYQLWLTIAYNLSLSPVCPSSLLLYPFRSIRFISIFMTALESL